MALGTPALATPGVGATANNVTTASFTPTEGDLLVVQVHARGASATEPTVTDSLGGTWTAVPSSYVDAGNTVLKVFYHTVGASPAARTITATSTGATQVTLATTGIANGEVTTNFHTDTDADASVIVVMDAYTAGNILIGGLMSNAGNATTPPTGFTELYDLNLATNSRSAMCYNLSPSETNLDYTGAGSDAIGWFLEITEAGGGGPSAQDITAALFTQPHTFHGASIVPAAVSITGALFTHTPTFFAATLAEDAAQDIDAALFTHTPTFFGATVVPDAATISAGLFTHSPVFYAGTVSLASASPGGDSVMLLLRRRRK